MTDFLWRFVATVFFTGYLPKIPGTWGSLVGIPLYLLCPYELFILAIPCLFFMGWWASYKIIQSNPDLKDPSFIVIDELYAMMAVLGFMPSFSQSKAINILLGFILFRFFDIVKPWPISFVDGYYKDSQNLFWISFGVMIDDGLAAIFSLTTLYLFFYIF